MANTGQQLRQILRDLSREWIEQGLPPAEALIRRAESLAEWKINQGISGLWTKKPLFLTATIDDGIGQGMRIIQAFAGILGLAVNDLGLTQSPEKIVAACQRHRPDFLGLTVLQLDSEDDLAYIGHHLPRRTRLIAGGPAFRYDPEMAARCGVTYVAGNVAYFIEYLTTLSPGE